MKINDFFKSIALIFSLAIFAFAQNPQPTATPKVVGEVTVTATKANIDPVYMYDKKTGDARFSTMMKDFLASHFNKDVTTEDFKAIVEKHITPELDIDKNGKMDWFFDQWVYGTEIPAYKFEYSINKVDGKTVMTANITQSDVSDNFVMPVPIYLDFGNGWVPLGSVTVVGNKPFDLGSIELPKAPKKVSIGAFSDVLATKIENIKK